MNEEPRFYTHTWSASEIKSILVINPEDDQNHRMVIEFTSCLPSITENYCITGLHTAAGGDIDECESIQVTKVSENTYEFFFYGLVDQSQSGGTGIVGKSFIPSDLTFYCCS